MCVSGLTIAMSESKEIMLEQVKQAKGPDVFFLKFSLGFLRVKSALSL
jgi:hypothetical protein